MTMASFVRGKVAASVLGKAGMRVLRGDQSWVDGAQSIGVRPACHNYGRFPACARAESPLQRLFELAADVRHAARSHGASRWRIQRVGVALTPASWRPGCQCRRARPLVSVRSTYLTERTQQA